jgi:Type VI secretion system effector, Hcp
MQLFKHLRSILPVFIALTALSSHAQQSLTYVATKGNNSCNGDCTILDIPQLNNNPDAIIWVTPIIEKGLNLNPHPIGAYYFQNQWRIFNLDQRPIPVDTRFKVEYVTSPDPDHFRYSITPEDIRRDGSAIIDHPALNNNPTVQFSSFLSWNPDLQRGTTNRDSITMQFNTATGKWHVSNINKKPLFARVTYNIVVSSRGTANNTPVINNLVQINELVIAPASPTVSGPVTQMYMTVWADGIKLPGESIIIAHQQQIELVDFQMGASNLSSSGLLSLSGKKAYEPITIKKRTGLPATIPLFNAFIKNQDVTATIEVFSLSSVGIAGFNYSIKLSGARIVSFKQIQEKEAPGQNNKQDGYFDEIKILFTKIEFIKDGVSVVDNL